VNCVVHLFVIIVTNVHVFVTTEGADWFVLTGWTLTDLVRRVGVTSCSRRVGSAIDAAD